MELGPQAVGRARDTSRDTQTRRAIIAGRLDVDRLTALMGF